MSDTPRTDEAERAHRRITGSREIYIVSADFARTLERELAAAKSELATIKDFGAGLSLGLCEEANKKLLSELAEAIKERDEADRRAGAAERKLEQAKQDFLKHRQSDRDVARSVWETHEKQFAEQQAEIDRLKIQLSKTVKSGA